MDDRAALSAVLTDLVRGVDGVTAVYSPAPVVVAAASSVASTVAATLAATATKAAAVVLPAGVTAATEVAPVSAAPGEAVLGADLPGETVLGSGVPGEAIVVPIGDGVTVRDEPEGLVVSLTIGVSAGAAAAEVCRTVYDAIADYLLTAGERPPASIAVKVGRIG